MQFSCYCNFAFLAPRAFQMNVELVHCTPDAERLIVKMARVSNPANEDNIETAPKLLRYLTRHRHWSPLEMANMCVKIETERDIAAQILRHRSFSFQEFSTRYSKTALAEIPAMRKQSTKNHQSSDDTLDDETLKRFTPQVNVMIRNSYLLYQEMLDAGVARETARRVLPLCTPTTLYMNGTLRSWVHYLQLRTAPDTQLEHRLVAERIKGIFTEQFPVISEAAFSLAW
jgi:thymidylate synthase (FAD)